MNDEATLDEFVDPPDDRNEEMVEDGLDPKVLTGVVEQWEKTPLADVADHREDSFVDGPFGANLLSEEFHEDGFARIIKLQNIRRGEFKDTNRRYVTRKKFDELERHGAYPGEIAIAKMADPVARACILPDFERQYILAAADCVKMDTNDDFNNWFVMYSLNSFPVWKQAFSRARGTGRKRINLNQLKEVQIPTPPYHDQIKIASVLYTVDQAMDKTEDIIDQANRIKEGIIKHLFENGTEGKEGLAAEDYPDRWEITPFADLIEDTRYGTDKKSNTEADGYPTLRIPNVVDKRITTDNLKHTPLDDNELDRLQLEDDDILIIRTNGNPDYVGRCATFTEKGDRFVFASYLVRIRVDETRVRPAFVREFLNSPQGRAEMAGWIRSSAGNYNLSVGAIERFKVPVPSLDEQDKIVEKIEYVEKLVQVNEVHYERLQRLKQGLKQDLLSGEVVTHDKDIEIVDEVLQHG